MTTASKMRWIADGITGDQDARGREYLRSALNTEAEKVVALINAAAHADVILRAKDGPTDNERAEASRLLQAVLAMCGGGDR